VQHDAELGMTGISAANPNSEIALSVQTWERQEGSFIPCNRKSDGVGADNIAAATDHVSGGESFIHSLILAQDPK
jgi:hypothetical protein